MTFEEAKKLLKKEFVVIGFHKSTESFEFDESGWLEHEKPSVLEAFRVLAKEGYYVAISGHDYNEREKRLKEEYEKNTKTPGPGEEQPKESNPALKEAASQFNDALLDEQAMKIKNLTMKNGILEDKIAMMNACKKYEDKIGRSKIKRLGKEIARLNKIIHDKNAVLSDVAEELRLSKIREKNLTEVSQKYMKENEELKNELDAFKVSYKRRIKEDSEHFEHIQKICNVCLQKWLLESEYLEKDKPFRFSNYDIARGKENKKPRISTPEEPKHDNGREDFIKKAIDSFNIRAANLGSVGSKDGNGIIDQMIGVDIAEEGGDHSAIIAQCCKNIAISKEEAKIIERCTKNGTELHYSEKDGFTYTNVFDDEMPIIYLRGMFHVFTDEENKNMKK